MAILTITGAVTAGALVAWLLMRAAGARRLAETTAAQGARLAAALFLTRSQLGGTTGDSATTLPPDVDRPAHWTG